MGELNVSFQIDTDNRDNFPNVVAFSTFRKQRDLFYETFRVWEENHTAPEWVFEKALGGRIRTLLTLHTDPINYYHFAKLFMAQLLISCIQNEQQADMVDDESISFLKTFKHLNPEKLTQLQKRLVTPQPSNSMGPVFSGVQEFFKDFILFAHNQIFYVHLENRLVHEIIVLNDTQFTNSEIEDSETTVDEQTQENFVTCVASLRLLAKVLGFLVSLPYMSESDSKEIWASQMEVRNNVQPSLNLHACLEEAITHGKLSLTVPWIAKYLAMMDSISLRLPYYKWAIEILYYIYKAVNECDSSTSDNPISHKTAILLKSTLGWLFELPNFPKDLYSGWQKIYTVKELQNLKQLDKYCVHTKNKMSEEPDTPVASSKFCLDKLDIISDRAMLKCCPSAGLKVSVPNSNAVHNSCGSNKHITPVSSPLRKPAGNAGIKHLELRLEEAFFHGQPASMRKTVDFVSERVASSCVKHICNTLLTTSRETNLNNFRKILKSKQDAAGNDVQKLKALLENEMKTLAANMSKELKDQCEATIPPICETRVAKSIEFLLPAESCPSVKEMCVKISTRLATERIHQWIQSHIVGGWLYMKDMELDITRFVRNNSPIHVPYVREHNPDALSPIVLTDEMRAMIWEILANGGKSLTVNSVSKILDNMYQTLHERADLTVAHEKVLFSLSTDFALFLVAHRMNLFTLKIQKKFIKVWALDRWQTIELDSPLNRLLSPRNVMLMAQPQKDNVWPLLGKFLKTLINKNVLDIDSLSDQCVALFRQDWPVPIMKHLSKCLTEAIAGYKATDESAEKVNYLLGWIAETYHEIEFSND